MKKPLLFFFLLLLPVLIFLFLRTFGKNEFEVPVLFMDSVTVPAACSGYSYQTPYVIEDSVLQKLSWSEKDSLTIIVFESENKISRHEQKIQVERVLTEFKKQPVHVIHIFNNKLIHDIKLDSKHKQISVNENEFPIILNCVFLLESLQDAVIIDSQKRIRGQYNLSKREDADRMIMQEMNILLKRY